jgi:hypothetical protein
LKGFLILQDETFRITVLDPIGKLAATFPEFNEAIKKRNKKLLDYDRARAGVKRLVDKPSSDPTSLPKVSICDIYLYH